MSKGVFIKRNGQLRKVVNVWTKKNGALKDEVMPKGLIGGSLREFMSCNIFPPYLYKDGVEFNRGWDAYQERGFNREESYIRLTEDTNFIYTKGMLDLTEYDTLYVEWEQLNLHSGFGIAISASKDVGYVHFPDEAGVANYNTSEQFSTRVDTLDISSLSGDYYIRIDIGLMAGDVPNLKVYKVWLE